MSKLPAYNAYNPCPKCGEVGARVTYQPYAYVDMPERLVRTCRTCGYQWPEACVDSNE